MSKFVQVATELRDLALIKRALDECQIKYEEDAVFTHRYGGFTGRVPLVMQMGGATVGLRPDKEGAYELLADDMQLRQIQPRMQGVQQRYAYHKVLAETAEAGFELVEEETDRGNVIRLTVRRWR